MNYMLRNSIRPIYHYLKNSNVREFNRLYRKYNNKPRYELHSNIGFLNYKCDIPDLASFIWQFKEIFVDKIYNFKPDSLSPVIFDCGANIGLACLYFKSLYPECSVKAFEADPDIAKILSKNLLTNNLSSIQVINKAVWIDDCGVDFCVDGADGGAISSQSQSSKKIESIRLKQFIEQEAHIDFLKMDIEGAETEVLLDCQNSLNNIKNIFIEYHSWNNNAQSLAEVLSVLQKNNFRYYAENISHRQQPLINKNSDKPMDLQMNIFAYRQ